MIRIFDDARSVIHVVASALSVLLHVNISFTILFIAYEYTEPEDVGHKLGDFIEWAIGLLTGSIVKYIMVVVWGLHLSP